MKNKLLTLLSAFFTYFVDTMSWAIVFPVIASYFADKNNLLFDATIDSNVRNVYFSIFLTLFPLGQFIASPIIGEFADKKGPRKALLYTILFASCAIFVSAFSVQYNYLGLLFISRFISGMFSGNLSVCVAVVSDISYNATKRVKNFGILALLAGISFVCGTFLGGVFSDNSLCSWFDVALPFWISACISFINFILVFFLFSDISPANPAKKFDILESIHNIQKALGNSKLRIMYIIYFMFVFSWSILLQFMPVILINKFNCKNVEIGIFSASVGILWGVGSALISRKLVKFFKQVRIFEAMLIIFSLFCAIIAFSESFFANLISIGICVLAASIAWPLFTNFISEHAETQFLTKSFGISQSMQALAMTLSPIAGCFFVISNTFPFMVGACVSCLASIIYFKMRGH